MMGRHPRFYTMLRSLVAAPGIGSVLYRLNTTDWFLRRMFVRHVYADPAWLSADLLTEKHNCSRQLGARFASAAFVTGALDPFADRDSWTEALRRAAFPVLLVIGSQTPAKSRTEMDRLAEARSRSALVVPGSLALHEEMADAIAGPVREFLAGQMLL